MNNADEIIIRKTSSLCPKCSKKIPAELVESNGSIYMQKTCPEHGNFKILVSKHAWYYKGLTNFYFRVIPKKMKQNRFYIYLSNKCNLNCPICLLEPNQDKMPDMSLDEFSKVLKKNKSSRFYLYGAEPTLRNDIEDWIKLLKKSGNLVNMHTNGIKLDNYEFLSNLKNCGLDYVSVQFDGFNDEIYKKLRGKELLEIKLKALENLKRLNIQTGLNVTIAKGVNEDQIKPILDFAINNPYIKDVSFATLSHLGDAQKHFSEDDLLMPDALIDMVDQQMNGKISRKSIFLFQKFYYVLLSFLNVRRCYNFQHTALVRDGDSFVTFDKVFEFDKFEQKLDDYRNKVQENSFIAKLKFSFSLLKNILGSQFIKKI
ncbi:MAG: radical SAM protein, partial [Candidatus Omnitrophica bacterium]|nr:radical SAM protein [Candidatus Omnitrophota bacterium]